MAVKMSNSLANMSPDSINCLINLYHCHPALWDVRSNDYRNKDLKSKSITSVRLSINSSIGIDCTDEEVQAKITGLRNQFTRELRKIKDSRKSGCGSQDVYSSKWPYFTQLQFLMPVIAATPSVSNLSEVAVDSSQAPIPSAVSFSCSSSNSCDEQLEDVILLEAEDSSVHQQFTVQKKRKTPQDNSNDFHFGVLEYLKNKKKPREEPPLQLWARNLAHNLSTIKYDKKRQLLQLDIGDMVNQAMREQIRKEEE